MACCATALHGRKFIVEVSKGGMTPEPESPMIDGAR